MSGDEQLSFGADDPLGRSAGADPAPPSFQASAGIQGRQFAEQCDTLLRHLGFELHGRRVLAEVGVEIDQEATSPSGTTIWFEYKGSVQGSRPGLIRTDTLKKAIAKCRKIKGKGRKAKRKRAACIRKARLKAAIKKCKKIKKAGKQAKCIKKARRRFK